MKNEFKLMNLKGTNDFLPEEQIIRNKIVDTLKKVFESYGYLPLETPILCYYELLASKYAGGSEILKEVYKLSDQADRLIGLRYDLTVPFSKVLGMNKGIILPFKRYEIGKVFRNGPVKAGRAREFYQCDVDACGLESPYAEVEYFSMTKDVFEALDIEVEVHYNNRKFLYGLLEHLNVNKDDISKFIVCVDKLDKLSEEDVKGELKEFVNGNIIEEVFGYFKLDFNTLFDKLNESNVTLLKEGLDELNKLNILLKELSMDKLCIFTPFLARGLDIYTGSVWEIFTKDKSFTSAVGGGGRYDNIITKFLNDGQVYPAIGFSFGLEPIYELLKTRESFQVNKYDIYV
ncbi:MAG: histidine--tRNA ligase, partial [Tenericutes bacterium]|nr:histidine--tRNA ligase [Mycoplasmatota bacterium]